VFYFLSAHAVTLVNKGEESPIGSILIELCEMHSFPKTRITSLTARVQEAAIEHMPQFVDLDDTENLRWAKDYRGLP